jgi:hypothetical protein
VHGPPTAGQLGCDLGHGPSFGSKPGSLHGPVGWGWLVDAEPEVGSDVVAVGRSESAIPPCAASRVLGPKGQRKTRKTNWASLATKQGQFVGRALLGMVGICIRSSAGCMIEIVLAGVVDQVTKLLLAASEEVAIAHRGLQLIRPAVAGWFSG